MLKGVLFILSACLIWGLNFIVPGLMTGFSPLEITLGGFFFLGVLSCSLMLGQGVDKWRAIPRTIWLQAIFFALVVNILYYLSLATGLRYSNASVIALLMGLSPITISFYGNWRQKECRNRVLVLPSVMIGSGLICVNWEALLSLSGQASLDYAFGLLCGILALITWNWQVVANVRFLKHNPHISSSDWSSLIGVGTFAWVLLFIPIFLATASPDDLQKYAQFEPVLFYFLAGCAVLGFMCSWLANYFWNVGSQALPIALAGQLSIFETLFGILFFYLLKGDFPTPLESAGMVITLTGVCLSMYLFRKPYKSLRRTPEPSQSQELLQSVALTT